mmetsp:Transcript_49558/g.79085  ORF Transcript_49558/g.79085 Transcript_49558/m.79085 type:complete len:392 (-) Transcript_49558:1140-2315(-)
MLDGSFIFVVRHFFHVPPLSPFSSTPSLAASDCFALDNILHCRLCLQIDFLFVLDNKTRHRHRSDRDEWQPHTLVLHDEHHPIRPRRRIDTTDRHYHHRFLLLLLLQIHFLVQEEQPMHSLSVAAAPTPLAWNPLLLSVTCSAFALFVDDGCPPLFLCALLECPFVSVWCHQTTHCQAADQFGPSSYTPVAVLLLLAECMHPLYHHHLYSYCDHLPVYPSPHWLRFSMSERAADDFVFLFLALPVSAFHFVGHSHVVAAWWRHHQIHRNTHNQTALHLVYHHCTPHDSAYGRHPEYCSGSPNPRSFPPHHPRRLLDHHVALPRHHYSVVYPYQYNPSPNSLDPVIAHRVDTHDHRVHPTLSAADPPANANKNRVHSVSLQPDREQECQITV